jgi:hypothetical protein
VRLPSAASVAFLGWVLAVVVEAVGCNDKTPPLDVEYRLPPRSSSADAGGDGASSQIPADADAASADVDAGPVTPPRCDVAKPFGAPTRIAGTDGAVLQATPRVSADELTIYFTTRDAGSGHTRLAKISRASASAAFGPMTLLDAQNSDADDNDPAPAFDHLSIWFQSTRGGSVDLFVATRPTVNDPFGAPSLVPNVNTGDTDAHAYFRQGGGGELWLVSNRNGDDFDVFVARKQGASFDAPTVVAELSSSSDDFQPQISEDGLTALLASNRPGGLGQSDLWFATRASTSMPFGAPTPLTELNSADTDQAGWLSADRCRIYFSSTRGTDHDQLYFAERAP